MRVLLFCLSLVFCGFSMFPVVVFAHQAEGVSQISPMFQQDKEWFFDWELKHGSIQDKLSYVLVVVKDGAWSGRWVSSASQISNIESLSVGFLYP